MGDIDTYYADNPWEAVDKNQRMWYDPTLINQWRLKSVFQNILTFTRNLGDVRAKTMTVTELLNPHPDFTALDNRQIWMPAMHLDSRSAEITFQHNGSKVAYHKYDDMVTYWQKNNASGLRTIMNGALGMSEVDINDLLARNALIGGALNGGFNMMINDRADFSAIATGDLFSPEVSDEIWLGMANRGVNMALGPNGADGFIVCYTTPGVIHDIQKDPDWISTRQYLRDYSLLNYEVGAYKNVRYVMTPKCTLWNCGTKIARANIAAAHSAGDGADPTTKVDSTYMVGQTTSGIKHYIQLGATAGDDAFLAAVKVNQIVTIHKAVTSKYGVTDGVDYNEGTSMYRRVVKVDTDNRRLVLDLPIMVDYDTAIDTNVYGFVTLGRNIHASIFVGGPEAIVAGVSQPARFYAPPPIDDFQSIFRFSWDQYLGYQPYRPELFEVVFSAGTTRVKGPAVVQ